MMLTSSVTHKPGVHIAGRHMHITPHIRATSSIECFGLSSARCGGDALHTVKSPEQACLKLTQVSQGLPRSQLQTQIDT